MYRYIGTSREKGWYTAVDLSLRALSTGYTVVYNTLYTSAHGRRGREENWWAEDERYFYLYTDDDP